MRKLFLVFILAGCGELYACKCNGWPTIKESFDQVDVILHGRVVNKEIITFQETFKADKGQEIKARLKNNKERALAYFESAQVSKVTIEVIEIFKGAIQSKTVVIYTTTSDASCGYRFEMNADYIIYGSRKQFSNSRFLTDIEKKQDVEKENTYWTHICTRTKKFDQQEAEELRGIKK